MPRQSSPTIWSPRSNVAQRNKSTLSSHLLCDLHSQSQQVYAECESLAGSDQHVHTKSTKQLVIFSDALFRKDVCKVIRINTSRRRPSGRVAQQPMLFSTRSTLWLEETTRMHYMDPKSATIIWRDFGDAENEIM